MQDKKIPNIGASLKRTLSDARLEAYAQMQGLQGEAVKRAMRKQTLQVFDDIYEANY